MKSKNGSMSAFIYGKSMGGSRTERTNGAGHEY